MSELKAYSGHEIFEDIDYNTKGIDPEDKEWNNYGKELCDTQYYLKSEADKVIADLEEKLKNSRNARKYWRKEYLLEHKECIHNKYKRCLAMVNYCHESAMWLEENGVTKSAVFMLRWEKRWLELAEKFKEATR